MPAALRCASRAVAFPVAQAPSVALKEACSAAARKAVADTHAFTKVLACVEGLARARGDTFPQANTDAEIFSDPEAFPDPQTYSGAEA